MAPVRTILPIERVKNFGSCTSCALFSVGVYKALGGISASLSQPRPFSTNVTLTQHGSYATFCCQRIILYSSVAVAWTGTTHFPMSEHSTYTVIMETCTYHNISTISVWRLTGVMTLYLKIAMYVMQLRGGGGGGGGCSLPGYIYDVPINIPD